MDSTTKNLLDIDLMFRAFSDPTRLRLLHLLQIHAELCVCDLVAVLELAQPLVSRHLAYLKRAGLVQDRRVGQWKHYSLTVAECSFHSNLLCCVSKCFREVPEFVEDAKRAVKILGPSRNSADSVEVSAKENSEARPGTLTANPRPSSTLVCSSR